MKILIWVIVAIVFIGGLAWFLSPDSNYEEQETSQNIDQELEGGEIIDTEENLLTEIDNALAGLE